jgi:hypothetical protein
MLTQSVGWSSDACGLEYFEGDRYCGGSGDGAVVVEQPGFLMAELILRW